jgi:hypothetical protein
LKNSVRVLEKGSTILFPPIFNYTFPHDDDRYEFRQPMELREQSDACNGYVEILRQRILTSSIASKSKRWAQTAPSSSLSACLLFPRPSA